MELIVNGRQCVLYLLRLLIYREYQLHLILHIDRIKGNHVKECGEEHVSICRNDQGEETEVDNDLQVLDRAKHLVHTGAHDDTQYGVDRCSTSDCGSCCAASGRCCDSRTQIHLVWYTLADVLILCDQVAIFVAEVA